jgi:hypothetical protein
MDQDNRTLDFLKLFVRHEHEIYAYILALAPHVHDPDDLFQEGMTVMWRKFDQFKPGTNLAAWGIEVMRYELNTPMEKIASYLGVSRRQVHRVLGQITDVLLRCMRRTMAGGSHPA